MSTPEKNDIDAQEIPLEQLSEVAGGAGQKGRAGDGNTHGGLSTGGGSGAAIHSSGAGGFRSPKKG